MELARELSLIRRYLEVGVGRFSILLALETHLPRGLRDPCPRPDHRRRHADSFSATGRLVTPETDVIAGTCLGCLFGGLVLAENVTHCREHPQMSDTKS